MGKTKSKCDSDLDDVAGEKNKSESLSDKDSLSKIEIVEISIDGMCGVY